jgi:hypothetical protein
MKRNLFTLASTVTGLLCVAAGTAYVMTMRVSMYDPGPEWTLHPVPWLGWSCVVFAVTTFALLLRQAHGIRTADERARSGLCPACGYDLRATPGRCPECGDNAPSARGPSP